ncbi:hypothetical protein [Pseudomonas sp. NPDC007930]|uniref:hypothetical protein n=1 Tax=Pseudomonas sp. NPDC007930 TaxID=3364417 RepID=UPI0036EE394B
MAKLNVQAGDFLQGTGEFKNAAFTLRSVNNPSMGETIPLDRIQRMTVANQETNRHFGTSLGWGMAGALLAGPIGFIAGFWLGGKEEEITFIATLKDGRKLQATADRKTFTQISGTLGPSNRRLALH